MTRQWTSVVLLAGLVVGCGAGAPEDVADDAAIAEAGQALTLAPQNIQSGGLTRTFQLSKPSSYSGQPLPLVFMLHGFGGGLGFAQSSGMIAKGEQQGFFVVGLLGRPCDPNHGDPNCVVGANGQFKRGWNSGIAPSTGIVADDVQYVRDVLAQVQADGWNVDTSRVYAAGLSSGGAMTHRLATAMPDVLAAVGVVSSAIGLQYNCDLACDPFNGYSCGWTGGGTSCATYKIGTTTPPAAGPIPVVIVHGSADDHLWWDGDVGVPAPAGPGLDAVPLQKSIDFWVAADGCVGPPQVTNFGPFVKTRYATCDLGSEVVSYFVEAMRHEWPPVQNTSFSATGALWSFFQQHTLP